MVNKEQVEGKVTEAKGKVTGDDSEELKGKIKGKYGEAKEKAEELVDDVASKVNDLFDKKDKK
ncbi:MAG TPA: CsbD family protein [Enterococcus sp.]|nr:CsbD family protein [Enterococcus sp.]